MRVTKTAAAMLALTAAIGVPAAGASKPKHPNHPAAKVAVKAPVTYVFRGVVAAVPGPSATALSVQINGGNKAATLKLGAFASTSFLLQVAPTTQLVSWSATNVPTANPALTATMQVGDPVAVTILGTRTATLQQLLTTAPTRIDDYLLSTKPHGRLFLFNGRAVSVDTVNHTVTMNVEKANWRASYALSQAGASTVEAFKYDPAKTVFVHWNAKGKQQLLTPDKIVAGDRITVKLFSVNYDMHLASLLATPAWRVNDHEPMALVNKAIKANNTHRF